MPQPVVDHLSNQNEHICRAIKLLCSSKPRRDVFNAVYHGKKACKTVGEIAITTGLTRKQVLQVGRFLASHHLVGQTRANSDTAYCKVQMYAAHKAQILTAASDPSKSKKALSGAAAPKNGAIHIGAIHHMGDKYVTGQAGAVGPRSQAQDIHFQQIWNSGTIETADLAKELATLRQHLKSSATTADADIQIGTLALAEQAATEGDGSKALSILKSAAAWVLEGARDLGVSIAAEAIVRAQRP